MSASIPPETHIIRRVKCDLTQPSCLKCKSTGRTCDGYPEPLPNTLRGAHPNDNRRTCTPASDHQPSQMQSPLEVIYGLTLHNPGTLMVLPSAEPTLTGAISFFDNVCIRHLNKYQLSDEPWRRTLMYFSHTVPSVRYAAVALSLLHRDYMYGSAGSSRSPKDSLLADKEAPLLYYNKSIRHLLDLDPSGHDGIEKTAITLLVCYLFTCFDHLAGNDVQAMKHLHGGVELSRNLDKFKSDNSGHIGSSDLGDLMVQVTSQIRRLDTQAVMFALDWTPSHIQESTTNRLKPSHIAFHSLAQAADSIHLLVAQAIRLRNTDEQMYPIGKSIPPPLHSSPKHALLNQLETWLGLFENMLKLQHNSYEANSENNALITLLRLQHKTAWIFTSSYGPGRETEYDAFLPHFQQCVAMEPNADILWSGARF
ncbi:hypothetical protein FGRMN_6835 [Fusarium graminum]|nr:hypothetical protein FGRMN_6835 [Fusarium graminum]